MWAALLGKNVPSGQARIVNSNRSSHSASKTVLYITDHADEHQRPGSDALPRMLILAFVVCIHPEETFLITFYHVIMSQSAFYVNLYRAVIGPSG